MKFSYITNMDKRYLIACYLLITLHIVGVWGITSAEYQSLFLSLSALNLLLSAVLVFLFHSNETKRLLLFIAVSALAGWLVEVVGVNTGWPFGEYFYGSSLGPKLLDVPLVIGLNWALLTYCTGSLAAMFLSNIWIRALLGALLMVLLDLCIEPMVHQLDFWHWKIGYAPIINYVGWYIVAVLLHLLYAKMLVNTHNKLVPVYYITVLLFFIALNVFT